MVDFGTVESRKEYVEAHPLIGATIFSAPIAIGGTVILILLGLPFTGAVIAGGLAFVGAAIPSWWMLRSTDQTEI